MISIDEAREQLAQEKAELEKEMVTETSSVVKAQERAYFTKEPEPEKEKGVLDYAASTSLGLAGGFSNAVADGINTVTDVMFMAGVNLAGAIDSDVDESAALKMWQDGRDKFIGFLQTKDDDDEVKNFVRNTTESLAKFAFIWKELGKAGVKSGMTKAVAAGAGEGFTNDPERELLMMDSAARMSIESLAPQHLADYDKLMNVEDTDSRTATQLTRRIMSGMEVALFAAGGEKAGQVIGANAGPLAKEAAKYIPDPIKQKTVDGFGFLLERGRQAKAWLRRKGDETKTLDDFVLSDKPVRNVEFDATKVNPDAGIDENIRASIKVEGSLTSSIPDANAYNSNIKQLEKELAKIVPQIRDEVVSMKKAKGLSDNAAIKELATASGIDLAEFNTKEGLRRTAQTMAHNIMLEESVAKAAAMHMQVERGVVGKEQYYNAMRDLIVTVKQRNAVTSSAGRVLRSSQEVDKAAVEAGKQATKKAQQQAEIFGNIDDIINDPDKLAVFSDGLGETLTKSRIFGTTPKEIEKSINKALRGEKKSAADLARAAGRIYQANLLSSTVTLSQNTIGSVTMGAMLSAETAMRSIYGKAMGNKQAPAISEAFVQFSELMRANIDSVMLFSKALRNPSGMDDEIMRFSQVKAMTPDQQKRLVQSHKTDIINANKETSLTKSRIGQVMTGQPVYGVIRIQDAVSKTGAARGYMHGRINSLIYKDDIFGIANLDAGKHKAVAKAASAMWKEGRVNLSADELKAAGFNQQEALRFEVALQEARAAASAEAVDYAQSVVLQQELSKNLQSAQLFLQDTVPFGRFIVPFFTTPANVINETIKRMPMIPLGEGAVGLPLHPEFYRMWQAGGAEREKALALVTTGNALMQLGMQLYDAGMLQDVPKSVEGRIGLDMMDKMPGSFVDAESGTSYSLAMLGPVGLMVLHGASMQAHKQELDQLGESPEFKDYFLHNLTSMLNTLREAPYAQSLDTIAGALEIDPENENRLEAFAKGIARKAGNLVPYSSLQRQMWNNMQQERVKQRSVSDAFWSQFYPNGLPKAYNVFGEPLKANTGVALRQKPFNDDTVMTAIVIGSGVYPRPTKTFTLPSDRFGAVEVELNDAQYEAYFDAIRTGAYSGGKTMRDELSKIVTSDTYRKNIDNMNYEANANLVNATIRAHEKRAMLYIYDKDVNLHNKFVEQLNKRYNDVQSTLPMPAGSTVPTFLGGGN